MSLFRADCSKCCGLCCVVHAQFAVQGFGRDKLPETPCAHLNRYDRCGIHAARRSQGYAACAGFDCYGAGQWITQRLFAGASWRDSPGQAAQMFEAYRRWAPRFEAAAMIEVALPRVRENRRREFVVMMNSLVAEDCESLAWPIDAAHLRREVGSMLRSAVCDDS